MIRCGVISLGCLLTVLWCRGQDVGGRLFSQPTEEDWHEGTIVLTNEETLAGYVLYDDNVRLIKFKPTPEDAVQNIVPDRVRTMEFFDAELGQYRQFAMFELNFENKPLEDFFEVILVYESFAILSKLSGISQAFRERSFTPSPGILAPADFITPSQRLSNSKTRVQVGYEQFETIYLVTDELTILDILEVSEFERKKDHPFAARIKPKLNKRHLIDFMGPQWPAIKAYVKENHLHLKKRDDLIAVFKYYAETY